MKLMLTIFIFFSSTICALELEPQYSTKPCQAIFIEGPEKLQFTGTEKVLLCGDERTSSWQNIPLSQARYFLKIFLENRGYWNLNIEEKDGKLLVKTGEKLTLERIETINSPIDLEIDKYWYPRGKPLTPTLLNEIENWIEQRLAEYGYPCAEITAIASKKDATVLVTIDAGELWRIDKIKAQKIPGLLGGIERRYDAFTPGEIYNAKDLELTSSRLVANDLVISSTFMPQCSGEKKGIVEQTLLPGQPRLISFGFGFDTEEYFMIRSLWQNGRIFTTGSLLKVQAFASYRRQNAQTTWDWYYLPFPSRHFLAILGKIERRNEKYFEELSATLAISPTWSTDFSASYMKVASGLSYEFIATPRGLGKDRLGLTIWNTNLLLMSHDYEFYQVSPRSGHSLQLSHSFSSKALGSSIAATNMQFQSTHLWNLANWQPPIFILGLRSELFTTQPGAKTAPRDLPAAFRSHLGGVKNLRGFGRNSLPPTSLGALTSIYIGSEFRLNNVVAYKLQPLVFADIAWLGDKFLSVDTTNTYWSPGFGVRWESPIGSLRLTIGHGMIEGEKSSEWNHLARWNFYFSLGEQF